MRKSHLNIKRKTQEVRVKVEILIKQRNKVLKYNIKFVLISPCTLALKD
jgi:hypothetical protein